VGFAGALVGAGLTPTIPNSASAHFSSAARFLLVVPIPFVDGGHGTVRDTAVIEHVRDAKPVHAGFAHVGGGRSTQIVRPELKRYAAPAQNRGRLFRAIDHTGRPVVRKHIPIVAVLRGRPLLQKSLPLSG
jgi:hypothetical protein